MAESQEPRQPRPPQPVVGAPLPRLWKAEPEPLPEPPKSKKKNGDQGAAPGAGKPGKKQKAGKAPKNEKSGKESTQKTVLLEETPNLDTYETRQRIRIITGVVSFGMILLIGFFIVRHFSPEPAVESPSGNEPQVSAPVAVNRERAEAEARTMLESAQSVARNGNAERAVAQLNRLKKSYPGTASAKEADEALGRPQQNLPLFLDRPAVVASPGAPKPAPAPPAPNRIEATAPDAPKATSAEASLILPANPAEPGMPVALNSPNATPSLVRATKPLPEGFRPRAGTAVHPSGWPIEIVGDRDGAPMMLVPGGSFTQGRDDGDPSESPSHSVTLATFYIDKHEVTVRQYALYLKETGKKDADRQRALAREPSSANANASASEDMPVVMVNAPEARDYAKWAGKRLPTEAQWEMAARGGDGRLYPWGFNPPIWDKKREPRQIDPVMSFPNDLSPFGAFDMAGNVMEWTKDWFETRYYHQFRQQPAADPTGPSRTRNSQLSVKGGAKNWTVTKREGFKLDSRLPFLGFRCVLQAEAPQAAAAPDANAPTGAAGVQNAVPF